MADLVIRGMEMPRVCIDNGWYGNCPMDRSWCAQRFAPEGSTTEDVHKEQWNKLPSWCPLAPIPEGHGRLIDADALMPDFVKARWAFFSDGDTFLQLLEHAPAIVPAEGGNADGNS